MLYRINFLSIKNLLAFEYIKNQQIIEQLWQSFTGISPLHGSHAAVSIACGGLVHVQAVAIREYHYPNMQVMAATLPKVTCKSLE